MILSVDSAKIVFFNFVHNKQTTSTKTFSQKNKYSTLCKIRKCRLMRKKGKATRGEEVMGKGLHKDSEYKCTTMTDLEAEVRFNGRDVHDPILGANFQ